LIAAEDPTAVFLEVPERARLSPEEHAPIAVPAGFYRVVRQHEFVPGSVRPVAD
jgi:hypothetical protein